MSEEQPLEVHDEIVPDPDPLPRNMELETEDLPNKDLDYVIGLYTESPKKAKLHEQDLKQIMEETGSNLKEVRKKIRNKLIQRGIKVDTRRYIMDWMKDPKRVEYGKILQSHVKKEQELVVPESQEYPLIPDVVIGDNKLEGRNVVISELHQPTIQKLIISKDTEILYSLYNACQEALGMKRPDVNISLEDVFKGIIIEYNGNGVKEIYASWGPPPSTTSD